jgi:beta-galactosidase
LWREAGPGWEVREATVSRIDDGSARITVTAYLPQVSANLTMAYLVRATGDVIVETSYASGSTRSLAMMPRFGTELVLAPGLENIAWYGRGPAETYVDRNFERIGLYKSTVDKEWVEYSRPQENGNKVDVRWVALTNARGVGLLAVATSPLGVAARHFTKDDLERAAYSFQMARHPQVFLNLDARQMGVGGIDSWSSNAWPLAAYRIQPSDPHTFRYRLTPVEGDFSAKTRERF